MSDKTPSQWRLNMLKAVLKLVEKHELTLVFALGVVLLLNAFHIPFSGILLVIGFSSVFCIYILASTAFERLKLTPIELLWLKLGNIVPAFMLVALLFLIMHWPGGMVFLKFCLLCLSVTLILILSQRKKHRAELRYWYMRLLTRVSVCLLIGAVLLWFSVFQEELFISSSIQQQPK